MLALFASHGALAIPAGFTNEPVLASLNQPVDIAVLPTGEMLVLEKPGSIVITNPAATVPQKVSYLVLPNVDSAEEKGLLSIALDPNFGINNYFYVYYHNTTTDRARISRFIHDIDHAHPEDEFVIWEDNLATATQSIGYHWGGGFGFGPDGYLYLAIGDKWDTATDAQDPSKTAGKIIRVDPSGADTGNGEWVQGAANAHLVPASNPFVDGAGGLPDEIWALGLRNAFRMSWDFPSGRLYIGEVGGNIQSGPDASHEDIHVATTSDGGVNFGWPLCEGPAADCSPAAPANFSPPIFSIQHVDARSITMGPVYRGSQFPSTYFGALFFADYTLGWLKYLTFDAAGNVSAGIPSTGYAFASFFELGSPVSLKIGADGALYFVDIASGQLRRIAYNSGNAAPVINQASASPTSSPTAPLTVNFTGSATDPEGQPLTYLWDFGDGSQASTASPSHQYTAKGSYDAILHVSDNLRTSTSDPVRIEIGDPPVPVIAEPADGLLFRAGDVISIRGSATDNDGVLTNENLKWTFRFLHDNHFHPILSGAPGTPCAPSGSTCTSITIPLSGHDYSGDTGYEFILTATDSDGISRSDSVTIRPDKVDLTFNSNVPGGVAFVLDNIPRNGPFVLDTMIGFSHTITAPNNVVSGGELYVFNGWSGGPATATRTVTVPTSNQTYTANYVNQGPVGTGPFVQQPNGTVAMQAEDFDANVSAGGTWSTQTPAGATGLNGEAMQATSGGRLEYQVNFNRTGTHYIYVRSFGATYQSNSVFIGMDGNWNSQYVHVDPLNTWNWEGPIAVNVGSTGTHTIGLTMRETGTLVDKVVILAAASTPTGTGPADTPREGGGGGNTAPVVNITAPANGSAYNLGDVINFTGTATDTQDGTLTSGLTWNSSINGNFGSTGSVSTSSLGAGVHTITASVTDSGALNGSDAITITVNDPGPGNTPPVVNITAPANGSSFNLGDVINFTGTATDTQDGTLTSGLTWNSNINGNFGNTGSVSTSSLGAGIHTITASVTDSGSLAGSDSISITVIDPGGGGGGTGPFVQQGNGTVSMQAEDFDANVSAGGTWSTQTPAGATGPSGQAMQATGGGRLEYQVNFNRTGTHYIYVRAFGATYQSNSVFIGMDGNWTSQFVHVDPLNTWTWEGPIAVNVGSTGTHTIGLTMRETGTLVDKVVILTTASTPTGSGPADTPREGGGGNTAPVVNITAPASGSAFDLGNVINFTGTASDTEDGPLTSGLTWNSNINGDFGSTGSVSTSGLSAGVHTITASVTDSGALGGSDSITITVNDPGPGNTPPVVNITAPASGSSFNLGDLINFTGTATDTEDGPLTAGLNWNSNINGDFGSTGSVSTSTLSAGVHTITASVTDSGSLAGSDNISITVIDPGGGGGGTGPFVQQADGTVSMQAEDFDANVSSGAPWSTITPAGATGPSGQAMQATSGSRLEYQVTFNRTGTHYIYVRAFGANYQSNSVFMGIDGNWNSQFVHVDPLNTWTWEGPIAVNVTSIGTHTIGLPAREVNTIVDKVVILTTASTPTGTGPAETPRAP